GSQHRPGIVLGQAGGCGLLLEDGAGQGLDEGADLVVLLAGSFVTSMNSSGPAAATRTASSAGSTLVRAATWRTRPSTSWARLLRMPTITLPRGPTRSVPSPSRMRPRSAATRVTRKPSPATRLGSITAGLHFTSQVSPERTNGIRVG